MDLSAFLYELLSLLSVSWWRTNWDELAKIIMIDVVLAGDNAIVVGLAASQVAPQLRAKVIFWGITAAVVLRILFAAMTTKLLTIVGLTLAGGLLLLWVCWRMYRQISGPTEHSLEDIESGNIASVPPDRQLSFWGAVWQITLADVSMSLDNVLAVAGVAKGSTLVPVLCPAIATVLVAVASHFIAGLLVKYPWISWVGLLVIVWVALDMIYAGSHEVSCKMYNFGCSETLWQGIKHRLGFYP